MLKRLIAASVLFTTALSTTASASDLPELLKVGDYMCKVSKEYKRRPCTVTKDGDKTILSFAGAGHLLGFKGVVFPADHMGKDKRVFVEATIQDEVPFICTLKDPVGAKECKEQTVMIELKKKGKNWVGTVPVKHYWDKWVGEGEARHAEGFEITVETFMVELRPAKKKKAQ